MFGVKLKLTRFMPFRPSISYRLVREYLLWPDWNFDDICHTFADMCTSGLGGHIAISGCLSLSHLFVDIF